MENKKRLSIEDPTGASSSALRRLTRSPTGHRLSLRRSSTSSTSSTSVSSSVEDEASASCVFRSTANDECALYRFIVWAAVKRNDCTKMTAEERRECPLLRCRKRFPTHELMLQHLYVCDHLAGGEYWCYECGKSEQLNDAKCKRCLGHPSKRKRIMSIAKNLFSSLGHKPKHQSFADLSSGLDTEEEPPSYESVFTPPPEPQGEYEIYSTEIHEIGSSEVRLPPIPECETETVIEPASVAPQGMASSSSFPLALNSGHPAVVEQEGLETDLINWEPSPSPSPNTGATPGALMEPIRGKPASRPSLQLNTHGLNKWHGKVQRRSKVLAPSSSVRSTSSTDSTDSTASTASYNISPMSSWSYGWNNTSDFESALTTPADDLISPHSFLPAESLNTSCRPMPFSNSEVDNMVGNSCPTELPADIPMFDLLSTENQESMNLAQPSLSFDPSVPVQVAMESTMVLPDSFSMAPPPPSELIPHPTGGSLTDSMSLIGSAQDALQMHIANSMSKLSDINKNPLVTQFCSMSPSSIIAAGLETMANVLGGGRVTSPVNLICFIHAIFSLSPVVHEQDASIQCACLFKQAMLYSTWFSDHEKEALIEVVYSLWKPNEVSDDDIINLLNGRSVENPTEPSSMSKGKHPEHSLRGLRSDPLIFLAQYFLDELDYSTLHDNTHTKVQASELAIQHIRDNLEVDKNSPFSIAAKFMLQEVFGRHFSHIPSLLFRLNALIDQIESCEVGTTRRLELELIQAGKMHLPSAIFYDSFIEFVRRQTDVLYAQSQTYFSQRSTYHQQGIQLMTSLITEANSNPSIAGNSVQTVPAPKHMDPIAATMPTNFDHFDFDAMINFDEEQSEHTNVVGEPTAGMDASIALDQTRWQTTPALVDPGFSTRPSGDAQPILPPSQIQGSGSSSSVSMERELSTPSKAARQDNGDSSSTSANVVQADSGCKLCSYRPKGDPRWFMGSMAKHMRTIHSENPQIFRCPYPGCTSQYSKRADNLRQHQIEKGHFVDGQELPTRRPRKRKRTTADEQ